MARYEVLEPVPGFPDYPVRYALEIFGGDLSNILYQSQDGFPNVSTEMFVELQSLVKLGRLAERLLAESSDTPNM